MKAQQVRTLILKNADLVALQDALDKLRNGKSLTAVESGVVDYEDIQNLNLAADTTPKVYFDGLYYVVFIFVTT